MARSVASERDAITSARRTPEEGGPGLCVPVGRSWPPMRGAGCMRHPQLDGCNQCCSVLRMIPSSPGWHFSPTPLLHQLPHAVGEDGEGDLLAVGLTTCQGLCHLFRL